METAAHSILKSRTGSRAAVLIFAASRRAPAFEAQMRVLEEEAERLQNANIAIACILEEGESEIGADRLPEEEAAQLRRIYGVDGEDFQIVVVNESGDVIRTDDTPLQGSAILRAAGRAEA